MIALGLLAAFATLFIAGCGVTALLMHGSQVYNAVEFFSLAALFGCGAVSLFLWCGGFFLSGPVLQSFVAILAVAMGAAGLRVLRVNRASFSWPKPRTALEWLFFAILALQIMTVVYVSLGQPLGWDGSFNWEIKARFAFLNGGTVPRSYYQSSWQTLSHPEYPLFIPLTQLWIDLWIGSAHQFWAKAIFPLLAVAGVLLLSLFAARLWGRRWLGLLVGVLSFFVPSLICGMGGITTGYADFPLGVVYFVAVSSLLWHRVTGDLVYFRIFAAALPLLPWLKREGAILWLTAVLCGVAVLRPRLGNPKIWLVLLPGALVLAVWALYLRFVGAAPSHDFIPISAQALVQRATWIWPITRTLLLQLIRADQWSLFWLLMFAAFIRQIIRPRREIVLLLAASLFVPMILYASSYVFSAWPDYHSHMRASLPRLLLQLTPLGWLMIALAGAASFRTGVPAAAVSASQKHATPLPVQ